MANGTQDGPRWRHSSPGGSDKNQHRLTGRRIGHGKERGQSVQWGGENCSKSASETGRLPWNTSRKARRKWKPRGAPERGDAGIDRRLLEMTRARRAGARPGVVRRCVARGSDGAQPRRGLRSIVRASWPQRGLCPSVPLPALIDLAAQVPWADAFGAPLLPLDAFLHAHDLGGAPNASGRRLLRLGASPVRPSSPRLLELRASAGPHEGCTAFEHFLFENSQSAGPSIPEPCDGAPWTACRRSQPKYTALASACSGRASAATTSGACSPTHANVPYRSRTADAGEHAKSRPDVETRYLGFPIHGHCDENRQIPCVRTHTGSGPQAVDRARRETGTTGCLRRRRTARRPQPLL